MMPFRRTWSTAILLVTLSPMLSADPLCRVKGPNYLSDPDFALEAEDANSPHWKSKRHAGPDSYRTDIDKGELTIRKVGPQDWFYFGQRLNIVEQRGAKMAFSADIKLDLIPATGVHFSPTPGGGLDINILAASGGFLWYSRRNHEPHLGQTDWETVQVVFVVPPNAAKIDLGFMHEADGTLQVRNPALREVDEAGQPCAVTPDAVQSGKPVEEELLR